MRLKALERFSRVLVLSVAAFVSVAAPPRPGVPASAASPGAYPRQPSRDALKWADRELKRMTLDEKIGQLISVGINATFLHQESEAYKALRRQIEQNHVGGIILFRGPVYESVHLVNQIGRAHV